MNHGQQGMRSENTVVPLAQSNLITSQDQCPSSDSFQRYANVMDLAQRHYDTLHSIRQYAETAPVKRFRLKDMQIPQIKFRSSTPLARDTTILSGQYDNTQDQHLAQETRNVLLSLKKHNTTVRQYNTTVRFVRFIRFVRFVWFIPVVFCLATKGNERNQVLVETEAG